jgi:hypothetical protein
MTDPLLDSLANALAGQAVSALSAAAKAALQKVRDLLGKRASRDPETQAALEAAQPARPETVRALAQRLDQVAGDDPELAELIGSARRVLHQEITAGDGGVVNTISGNAQKVVQARDIHGGITFN